MMNITTSSQQERARHINVQIGEGNTREPVKVFLTAGRERVVKVQEWRQLMAVVCREPTSGACGF